MRPKEIGKRVDRCRSRGKKRNGLGSVADRHLETARAQLDDLQNVRRQRKEDFARCLDERDAALAEVDAALAEVERLKSVQDAKAVAVYEIQELLISTLREQRAIAVEGLRKIAEQPSRLPFAPKSQGYAAETAKSVLKSLKPMTDTE